MQDLNLLWNWLSANPDDSLHAEGRHLGPSVFHIIQYAFGYSELWAVLRVDQNINSDDLWLLWAPF